MALSAVLLIGCNAPTDPTLHQSSAYEPIVVSTPTSTIRLGLAPIALTPVDALERAPTPTPIPPTPTPAPAPVRAQAPPQLSHTGYGAGAPGSLTRDEMVALLRPYDWPIEEALAVALCESGWSPSAQNPSGATGLFQIHPYNPAMLDAVTNVAAAYSKYLDGVRTGNPWKHWNQFGSCGWF